MLALAGTLIGVAVGFGLSWLDGWFRRRRAGRTAARLIFLELASNGAKLQTFLDDGEWVGREIPRRSAWEALGSSLSPVASMDDLKALSLAYAGFDYVTWLIDQDLVETMTGPNASTAVRQRLQDADAACRIASRIAKHPLPPDWPRVPQGSS